MAIIDSQVHAYEANTPQRPWHTVPNWPAHVTGDEMVAAMDTVGVDGAILISAFSMYQYDASYAVDVQRAHPDRFALVKPVNPDDPAVAEVIADWKQTPGTVGIRIMMTPEAGRAPHDPGLDRILISGHRGGGNAMVSHHFVSQLVLCALRLLNSRGILTALGT
jgi:predicted TIM-barrel fold metal-dependent hydrolase